MKYQWLEYLGTKTWFRLDVRLKWILQKHSVM
jgi:hypothetical protein